MPLYKCVLAGFHAGTDISGFVPGKLPHYLKSRPPEVSEKPGKGAEEGLKEKGKGLAAKRPVILNAHTRWSD